MGSVGEDVRALQRLLNARGYAIALTGVGSPGNESDTFGAKTRAALVKFQKAQGITPASGYYGPMTRMRLATTPTPTAPVVAPTSVRDLELGMSGDDVRSLQQWLLDTQQALPLTITGYFGTQTQAALRAYQKREGISPATGYFGVKTRAALQAAGAQGLWW
jgi:peptidoglycan hydrolase-like protein with peptidoglycan-binding domain